jgi:pimeloyl-ACP methyl ester carboxylesterase
MKHRIWLSILFIGNAACASTPTAPIAGISSHISQVQTLALSEGQMAYEDSGTQGPVVILVPGMGDTRGQFRFLGPELIAAGLRVITVDPRGEGDSDATFSIYAASSVGDDLVRLIDQLGAEVYLVGNSSGGGSVAWAAATRPDPVKGVIFIDAFLRDHPISFFNKLLLKVALTGPWAASSWVSYYRGLYVANPPKDQDQYTEFLRQSLNKEGHIHALRAMVFASKADIEAKLKEIHAPVLAIAGSKDSDFENGAENELNWILSQTGGEKQLIDGAGHYPHVEYPDQVAKLIRDYLAKH